MLWDFQCEKCGHLAEIWADNSKVEEAKPKCPKCKNRMKKVVSALRFKI
jgi:putative FmdB family regulatory protein